MPKREWWNLSWRDSTAWTLFRLVARKEHADQAWNATNILAAKERPPVR